MRVKIESDRHGCAKVYLDGQEVRGILSLRLYMATQEPNELEIEYLSRVVQFEGEAQVFAIIEGRRYQLIENEDGTNIL